MSHMGKRWYIIARARLCLCHGIKLVDNVRVRGHFGGSATSLEGPRSLLWVRDYSGWSATFFGGSVTTLQGTQPLWRVRDHSQPERIMVNGQNYPDQVSQPGYAMAARAKKKKIVSDPAVGSSLTRSRRLDRQGQVHGPKHCDIVIKYQPLCYMGLKVVST